MKRVLAIVAAIVCVPATAGAMGEKTHGPTPRPTTCGTAYNVRVIVTKRHGSRAPGRNICRFGIRYVASPKGAKRKVWKVRDAKPREKRAYLRNLRKLIAPPRPYMVTRAIPPGLAPAGTMSAGLAPTGLAACIVHYESHGDPMASNGSHEGIGQWDANAWAKMGGLRYASHPSGASYQQQLAVLSSGLAHFGCVDWCPYDPC